MTGLIGRVRLSRRDGGNGSDGGNSKGSREGDSAGGGVEFHAKA